MKYKLVFIVVFGLLLTACQTKKTVAHSNITEETLWNLESLNDRAMQHLDSTKWEVKLFNQDIDTYTKYPEVFQSYPLNKSPFPVADYDYAVSYIPFSVETTKPIFKGVRIGECKTPDCDKVIEKLTLMVVTNDKDSKEVSLVESRNYPYLTAQGYFITKSNKFDWVFSSSPDGFSMLIINMKLFDLRFGETIIIYPQNNKSFLYEQIKDSPNNYSNFEEYKWAIINNKKVKHWLTSEKN